MQRSSDEVSVSIRDVSLNFGSVKVLQSLNLEVGAGEFVVLLGPSGCGKSTLLNCIAGLLDVSDGQIFIGGKNVTWEEPKDRGIGMVFQSYALYPQMTVERNLSFGLRVAGLPRDRDRTARQAGLRDPADRATARAQAGQSIGRPAPARRHRPRPGARRRRVPVRRAAIQSRCQAPLRPAGRDQAAASTAQKHHDLCDARPDRGDDAGRPHCDHEEWRHPAAGHAARCLSTIRSICSSPGSSGRQR